MVLPRESVDELESKDLIELNEKIIDSSGGTKGIRDIGTLDNLIYYQLDQKNNIYRNAAIVLYSILTRHPFFDGNKRTGYVLARLILLTENVDITADDDEIETFLLKIASYEFNCRKVEEWLKEHTKKQ